MDNIVAKKSLGQNFLKDEQVLQKIANSFETQENDLIIEVGPGKGALTKYLVLKEGDYLGYEIDTRMIDFLSKYTSRNKKIIYEDYLKQDLSNISSYQHIYVVANIPYYITTPIIEHTLQSLPVDGMTLLVQKEVAQRFSALPGSRDYGYFTVLLNHFFTIEYLFDVAPALFDPPPKVMSAVVKLVRKRDIKEVELNSFQSFLKLILSKKRKTLKNNLKGYDFQVISSILLKYGYSLQARAEELSYNTILELYQKLVLKN